MRQCMDAENLHRRLKKIIGQVQAIDRMVEEDIACEDMLSQINAAKSALHRVGQIVLEGHLHHCVLDGIEHGDAEETIAKFSKAVERFSKYGIISKEGTMYPVNIKMDGRACLVIGGGHVAQRKVCTLLEEKAAVTVIAPEVCSDLEALFREGRISWRRESYEAPMCGGFCMVVTAAGDKAVALSVQKEAEREGFLYNAADFPALGNCHIPARIKKEGLMVTVSTEGRSPAMAKYVKNWLALEIPDAYGQWLDRMGALRSVLQEGLADAEQREKFWRLAFEHQVMELVVQGNLDAAEERVRSGISRLRSES